MESEDSFSDEYNSEIELSSENDEEGECESVDSLAALLLECESYTGETLSNFEGASRVCCIAHMLVLLSDGKYKPFDELRKGDCIWTDVGNINVCNHFRAKNSRLECFEMKGFCGSAMISEDCANWSHSSKGVQGCSSEVHFITTDEPKFVIFNGSIYIEIDNSKLICDAHSNADGNADRDDCDAHSNTDCDADRDAVRDVHVRCSFAVNGCLAEVRLH